MNMLYLRREDTHVYEDISDYSVIKDIPVRSSRLSPKYEAIDDATHAGDSQEQNERYYQITKKAMHEPSL